MECDFGGAGDPPVPVGETDGFEQAYFAAGGDVACDWADWVVCGGESRVVCVYLGGNREGDDGDCVGEHPDWTFAVAGTPFGFNCAVLAS